MLSISEGIITLEKADKQDEQYVKECEKEEDFVQYIGIESTNKEECFIMFADKKRIGLFFLRDDTSFGLNIGRLSVYVDRKYRLLSANCILKAIGYSLHKNYEKLEFMVLKNNYKCLKLFDFFEIEPEYTLPYGKGEMELVSFSIYPEDVERLKTKIKVSNE